MIVCQGAPPRCEGPVVAQWMKARCGGAKIAAVFLDPNQGMNKYEGDTAPMSPLALQQTVVQFKTSGAVGPDFVFVTFCAADQVGEYKQAFIAEGCKAASIDHHIWVQVLHPIIIDLLRSCHS